MALRNGASVFLGSVGALGVWYSAVSHAEVIHAAEVSELLVWSEN